MIYELRTYTLTPGKALEYLELFRLSGINRVTRFLPMGGYWLTDTGRLNVIHHLWIYESLEERAQARVNFAGDEIWTKEFVPAAFPLIQNQSNALMVVERGSVELEKATAARKTVHGNQEPDDAAFSSSLLTLSTGSGAAPAEVRNEIGLWHVVSGDMPGRWVQLVRETGDPLTNTGRVMLDWSELLRPLSFSPIR